MSKEQLSMTPETAKEQLERLMALYWDGQHLPLPVFQSASYCLMKKNNKKKGNSRKDDPKQKQKRKKELIKEFMDNDWENPYDRSESYAIRLLYPEPEIIFDEKSEVFQQFSKNAETMYAVFFKDQTTMQKKEDENND